ncbi:MAG: putative amidoligase domain-containing protein, partial [Pyrinomonadaceae bacterium]
MDIMLGIPSTILDCSKAAVARRELYGKAGCHRIPDHGVEYRTLSNYWLKSPELVMLIYSLTNDAVKLVQEKTLDGLIERIGAEDIQAIINSGNKKQAAEVIDKYIKKHMSKESLELFDMCLSKIKKIKALSAEWQL